MTRQVRMVMLLGLLAVLAGCAAFGLARLERERGPAMPREYEPMAAAITYQEQVRPLLEQRCVVCHGCFDAPCQLNLQSYQGLLRGAHKKPVYDASRLTGASLTRMFEDAETTARWRDKGFFPVLDERRPDPEQPLRGNILAQLLHLKADNPLPTDVVQLDGFEFAVDAQHQCPREDEIDRFGTRYPQRGMPYALPGLNAREQELLLDWLALGAPAGRPPAPDPALSEPLRTWEAFFNGDSKRRQLVARYLYEHLFLASLYFDEAPDVYFRLVRSRTPPGQPIERISSRRPFDDPGVERVYYRLWRDPSSVVAKAHLPYRLDAARLARWQQWFLEADYIVSGLPSYDPDTAANPFLTFAQLPMNARYRFLLDEAHFTIMNFIKGPVCHGQVALNVIQDHFWVYFVDPDFNSERGSAEFLAEHGALLNMPAGRGDTWRPVSAWRDYSQRYTSYLEARAEHVRDRLNDSGGVGLNLIWDGDGDNTNAALTVFRHSDSASVSRGLLGAEPKTAWLIDYSLLERIHYLLVAGFDVYGNVSHQVLTRMYMDFLRMEGEMNFAALLPEEQRRAEVAHWYREAEEQIEKYLALYLDKLVHVHSELDFRSAAPKSELFSMLREHLHPVLARDQELPAGLEQRTREALEKLQALRGEQYQPLPQVTLIQIPELGVFTLLQNSAYLNLSSMFLEERRRVPEEDTVTLLFGVQGSYPNALLRVHEADLPDFAERLVALGSEQDYRALRDRYGIRRNHPDFWAVSDSIHAWYALNQPQDYGLLDYNRLENR